MKYDWLENKVADLVRDIKFAVERADNEDDFERLTDILEDLVGGIPRQVLLIDYWTRYGIVNRMRPQKRRDTKYINQLMEYLYSNDTICFDEEIVDYINQDIYNFEAEYGLQEQTKD